MTKNKKLNICVVGLGYVGLPLTIALSKKFRVTGFDINKTRINQLKRGRDLTQEIKINKIFKRIKFTSNIFDCKNYNVYVVAVPTPVKKNNSPDLNPLNKACKLVASVMKKNSVIIFESTVYPGCTEDYCGPILEKYSNFKLNKDFFLGYSPERINPGKTNYKINKIVKVTSGSNSKISRFVDNIYKKIIPAGTHLAPSIKVAEAAKVIENTQRDINIAFINELSILFNKIKIDTNEVLKAAATKWNFNKYYPGLVGGHCIGVDPYYLSYKAKILGLTSHLTLAGRKVNNYIPTYVFNNIKKELINSKKKLNKSKVLILGATFKENCPDFRNSKVFDIMEKLYLNKINFKVFDPYYSNNLINNKKFKSKFFSRKIIGKFDIIVIALAHNYFKKMGIKKISKHLTLDGKIFDLKSIFSKKLTFFRL